MPIELTDQQQQILDAAHGSPLTVVDPRTHLSYVLVPVNDYEAFQDFLDDERQQQAIRRVAMRNAIGRMEEEP
jgi:PHD/YefM family antitoxin component YafN of YafNO toxin-antitoxin module